MSWQTLRLADEGNTCGNTDELAGFSRHVLQPIDYPMWDGQKHISTLRVRARKTEV